MEGQIKPEEVISPEVARELKKVTKSINDLTNAFNNLPDFIKDALVEKIRPNN